LKTQGESAEGNGPEEVGTLFGEERILYPNIRLGNMDDDET